MKTNLISKAVMFAVFAMSTSAYAEGFNLERISKDTLDQAYIGGVADQGVETSVLDTASQAKAPAAAERPAAAKPALAAKVPMPATADSKQYKNALSHSEAKYAYHYSDAKYVAYFIKNCAVTTIALPIIIIGTIFGGTNYFVKVIDSIWGGL